jgi:small Trp-rich protein
MYLVLLGLLLLAMKWFEFGPVAGWSWWTVLAPFAGAIVWWTWADATGYYKRREMRDLDERQKRRREQKMDAIGTGSRTRRGR